MCHVVCVDEIKRDPGVGDARRDGAVSPLCSAIYGA